MWKTWLVELRARRPFNQRLNIAVTPDPRTYGARQQRHDLDGFLSTGWRAYLGKARGETYHL